MTVDSFFEDPELRQLFPTRNHNLALVVAHGHSHDIVHVASGVAVGYLAATRPRSCWRCCAQAAAAGQRSAQAQAADSTGTTRPCAASAKASTGECECA